MEGFFNLGNEPKAGKRNPSGGRPPEPPRGWLPSINMSAKI